MSKTCPNCSMVIPEPIKIPKTPKKVLSEQEKIDLQFKRLATTVKKLKIINKQKVLELISLD